MKTLVVQSSSLQRRPRSTSATWKAALQLRPRGSIMVVAIGVIVVLASLVLVYSQEMRIEAQAASNRASQLQAAGAARAAIAYVNNHLLSDTDPLALDTELSCEAVPVGDSYFWIVRPNPTDETQYQFGLVDESSKININSASFNELMALPNMTSELAAAIIDWRDADDNIDPNGGAENEFYLGLPEPYYCKNDTFETPEEILLVKGSSPELLFGVDANHNGIVDASENTGSSTSTLSSLNGQSRCGIMKYLTVYSRETNVSASGKARLNINTASTQQIDRLLISVLGAAKAAAVMPNLRRKPFTSTFDFYFKSGMALADFKRIADSITVSPAKILTGLINVNTAPKEVLMCLPGLAEGDADALIAARPTGGTTTGSAAWVLDVLSKEKALAVSNFITVKTKRFSADIVGVSGDGRGMKRVKCVWDVSGTAPKLLYYRDLSPLGWPLDPAILDGLRAGQGAVPTGSSGGFNLKSNTGSSGSSSSKLGGSL